MQTYKRSFGASMRSGFGSLFRGSGRQYYILEHKNNSTYHKVGELQEIIVDHIELGRDAKCQVRFDDSFTSVSRRHAAIIRAADKWKLVQISQTNLTLLNGNPITNELYLQNGDEIQLSGTGPKLGFIIPAGTRSTVGSIGLSKRFSLFRQQALRPYKMAFSALAGFLLLAVIGAAVVLYKVKEQLQTDITLTATAIATQMADNNNSMQLLIDSLMVKNEQLSQRSNSPVIESVIRPAAPDIQTLLDRCKEDVYFITTEFIYVTDGDTSEIVKGVTGSLYNVAGTGFLLDDGRFVTARHCIQPWRYLIIPDNPFDNTRYDDLVIRKILTVCNDSKYEMVAALKAVNRSGKTLTFNSVDFKYNDKHDKTLQTGKTDENARPLVLIKADADDENDPVFATDWAYIQTTQRGALAYDNLLSRELKAGAELHVLGFPGFTGVGETPNNIEPAYNNFRVGLSGLNNAGCFLHTRGTDHGNSGGPIFTKQGDRLVVVGIVSRGSQKSDEYNYAVPVSALQ